MIHSINDESLTSQVEGLIRYLPLIIVHEGKCHFDPFASFTVNYPRGAPHDGIFSTRRHGLTELNTALMVYRTAAATSIHPPRFTAISLLEKEPIHFFVSQTEVS